MPHTTAPGPAIYYETSGDPGGLPLVLIEGMTAQFIGWRDGFVAKLVERGMFVIRLDNRDVGLSDKLGSPEDLMAPYAFDDMAKDVCRVLDALGIESAHIVGQSMGGGIAQVIALNHPERIRSMVLFYTAPAFDDRFITDEIKAAMAEAPAFIQRPRAEAIDLFVHHQRLTGVSDQDFDEEWQRELGGLSYDRCNRPDGHARQMTCVMGSGDRSEKLPWLTLSTAIIHGRKDRLVKVDASLELARLIPNSELHIYPDMGHQIIERLWDDFVDIIARTAARALIS